MEGMREISNTPAEGFAANIKQYKSTTCEYGYPTVESKKYERGYGYELNGNLINKNEFDPETHAPEDLQLRQSRRHRHRDDEVRAEPLPDGVRREREHDPSAGQRPGAHQGDELRLEQPDTDGVQSRHRRPLLALRGIAALGHPCPAQFVNWSEILYITN